MTFFFFCFSISRGGAQAPWAPPPGHAPAKTHQIAPFKKNSQGGGAYPRTPLKRRAQYVFMSFGGMQTGCIFLPNIIPPMFEHGFTPLTITIKIYKICRQVGTVLSYMYYLESSQLLLQAEKHSV